MLEMTLERIAAGLETGLSSDMVGRRVWLAEYRETEEKEKEKREEHEEQKTEGRHTRQFTKRREKGYALYAVRLAGWGRTDERTNGRTNGRSSNRRFALVCC